VIAYGAALAVYLLSLLTPVENAELRTLDWRFTFRGPVGEKPANLALVNVDEQAGLPYRKPIPRRHLAAVVRALHAAGAQLIGMDVFLGERSFDAAGDSLLRAALLDADNVVLASLLEQHESGLSERLPLPYFADAALDWGIGSFYTALDVEAVRQGTAAFGINGKHALSFAGCLYAQSKGKKWDTEIFRHMSWTERTKEAKELPGSNNDYRVIIDFNGPPYQYYRSLDGEQKGGLAAFSSQTLITLDPAIARTLFGDRIVLVGSGFEDASARFRTPFFSRRYGYHKTFSVEIQAQLLNTLLKSDRLARGGFVVNATLLLGLVIVVAFTALRTPVYWALPATLCWVLLWWVLGFYLFISHAVVVSLFMPSFACGLACLFAVAYRASTDGRRRHELKERFGTMVSPAQLQELLDQHESWETEGEERLVAVVWLRLHTGNPQRSARETFLFYQGIWEHFSPLVFHRGGTVFRYEEDGLGLVFGIPLPQQKPEVRAVMAAIDLQEAWLEYRAEAAADGWDVRIGAALGPAFVGDLGGDVRYAYRVLGGPVDQARALAIGQDAEGVYITGTMMRQVEDLVEAEALGPATEEGIYRLSGRAHSPPIGAARGLQHPLWKHLGFGHRKRDQTLELFIGGLSIFSDFTRRDLGIIRPLFFHRSFKAGETVFRRGEVGSAMYIVQHGAVDILQENEAGDKRQLLQRLGIGDFFGELALLSDLERSAAAIAYESTQLLVLFQNDMFSLIEREPDLGVRLIRMLSRVLGERLLRLNEEYARNMNKAGPREDAQE